MRLSGYEAFYNYDEKVLEGMNSSHVDDFILGGKDEFVKEITKKVKGNLLQIGKRTLTGVHLPSSFISK